MDADSMKDALRTTDERLAKVESDMSRLEAERDALRRIKSGIEDYLGLTPDPEARHAYGMAPPPVTPSVGPRGREAVLRVLSDRPGYPMTAQQVADEIEQRGWIESGANALDATRASLTRAVKHFNEVHRVGHGVYVFEPEDADGPTRGPSEPDTQRGGGLMDPPPSLSR